MREETVLIVVCLLLSIAIVIVSMCMFEWRPKLPKLFHKVPGDEVIPDGTFGIVIREADQPVRWRELLFIVPVPGRYMRLVDFDQAVVLNARINAWVGFHIPPVDGCHRCDAVSRCAAVATCTSITDCCACTALRKFTQKED